METNGGEVMFFDALFATEIRDEDRIALIRDLKDASTPLLRNLGAKIEANRIKLIWMPEPPKPRLPELIAGERL